MSDEWRGVTWMARFTPPDLSRGVLVTVGFLTALVLLVLLVVGVVAFGVEVPPLLLPLLTPLIGLPLTIPLDRKANGHALPAPPPMEDAE